MVKYKDIPGYEGHYQITNDGRVWSIKSNKFLSLNLSGPENKKYYSICLCKENKKAGFKIHRLVAEAFLPNPNNLPCVNHKDCNKLNNHIDNLEWCSYKENNDYLDRKEKMVTTRKRNGNCSQIFVCDKNNPDVVIQEFESIADATRFLNLPLSASGNICAVIKGTKKSAYGYFWRLKN